MTRIAPIDPATATGKARELFDGPLKGMHINIFKSMAASPAAVQAYLGMAGALKHSGLSAKEQEVVQLTVGQANSCDYCVAAHTFIGKGAGLTEAQTVGARRGKPGDAKLDALSRFVLTLHEKRGNVSDDDVKGFKAAGYTDGNLAEVVAAYALATFTNYFNHVNQTPVDFPSPPTL